jgi:hypothetical protein
MTRIIICNVDTQEMAPAPATEIEIALSAGRAWRQLWMVEAGDAVVLPAPASAGELQRIYDCLHISVSDVHVVVPDGFDGRPILLSDSVLLSESVLSKLKAWRGSVKGDDYELLPYFYTPGIVKLADILEISPPPGSEFAAQRGPAFLNSKATFRQLAAANRCSIAVGSVVSDRSEFAASINNCLFDTGTVIVKRDRDAGGYGNVALTLSNPRPLPGTSETIEVHSGEIESVAHQLWDRLRGNVHEPLIVEVYHEALHIVYFELAVTAEGGIRFLNNGFLRMSPGVMDGQETGLLWSGFAIPVTVAPYTGAKLAAAIYQVARLAASVGYRGRLSVDAIVTLSNTIIVNEVNARLGGCSHLHALAVRLLGHNYGDYYTLRTSNDVPSPDPAELADLLAKHQLCYDTEQRRGVLIVVHDHIYTKTIQYAAVSRDAADAEELEHRFLFALSQSVKTEHSDWSICEGLKLAHAARLNGQASL